MTKPSDYRLATSDYHIGIREATSDEAETVLAIEQAAFNEYREILDPPSSVFRETPDTIREKMAQGQFLFALLENHPVGIVFNQPYERHVYLGRLAVLPDHQRQGIGAALIAEVERRARELGKNRVRLGVRVALPHLRDRYERLGYEFVEARSHEGYDEATWVVMEKELAHETRRQEEEKTRS